MTETAGAGVPTTNTAELDCSGCGFWMADRNIRKAGRETPDWRTDGYAAGECHRHAPTSPLWPRTVAADWCGDWEPTI